MRKYIFFSLLIITPVGFLCKIYTGVFSGWVQNSLAGIFYEIFWCLVVFFFLPREKSITTIAAGVFLVTALLEILQLWQPPFLEQIRSHFLGRTLLGTTFSWWDFPHYLAGSLLGGWWLKRLVKNTEKVR
ncbi:MAG TPA: DUF2809 domain-containing protein [Caldithrix sp.]|nr:DUF2809 domain-containing protein [Caldithrix sp.]